jgi:translation initiation factor 1A
MTKKKRSRARGGKGDAKVRDIPTTDDAQVYGCVQRLLGNGRLMAKCSDGVERQCRIRGSMRRREWVRVGDTVLVALRPFEDDKADVVHRYDPQDVTTLRRMGENVCIATHDDDDPVDSLVTFGDADDVPDDVPADGVPDQAASSKPTDDMDWDLI